LPFFLRGRAGELRVVINANESPIRVGCDLLDPTLPSDLAVGFPVCEATPTIGLEGYAATCGWIQVVRSTDASDEFELDPLSLFRDVDMPFAFFGVKPVLFDAPFRETRHDLAWTARAFLCAVPDAVMSKIVVPVAAFEWGFTVTEGSIAIDAATALDVGRWQAHVSLLRAAFPNWTFADAGG